MATSTADTLCGKEVVSQSLPELCDGGVGKIGMER